MPRTIKRGITDMESYDPKIHGSFPDYFNKVRSRIIHGLVSKAIEAKTTIPVTHRRSHQKGGGTVERKARPPLPPTHVSDEYPTYKPDKLDQAIHA